MDHSVIVGSLRALLFCTALFSAATYVQEVSSLWTIFCALFHRKFSTHHFVGLAAFGWLAGSVSSMLMTGPRLWRAIQLAHNPHFSVVGVEAYIYEASLLGFAIGFYLPVFAMMIYRDRVWSAVLAGIACIAVATAFAMLPAANVI